MAYQADAIQAINFGAVQRIISNFRKDSSTRHNEAYFETRLEKLRSAWKTCENQHLKTNELCSSDEEKLKAYTAEYAELEESVLEYVTLFTQKLYEHRPSAAHRSAATVDSLKLERIKVPTFNGKYAEWSSFRDLYRSMVHVNDQLTPVQKMQYLHNAVTGEAQAVIRHLNITDNNYQLAWDLLCERFNNHRAIAQQIMQRFWDIRKSGVNDHQGLKTILDVTNQLLASIRTLELNPFDLVAVHILNMKLDDDSRKDWQKSISSNMDVPSLNSFLQFVKQRFHMLEALNMSQTSSKASRQLPVSSHSAQVADPTTCIMCKTSSHGLFNCDFFKQLDIQRRRKVIESNRLCFNCLSNNHIASKCPSKRHCKKCDKRHNTLLHQEPAQTERQQAAHIRNHHVNTKNPYQHVILGTAILQVQSSNGELIPLRALFDSGSQRSFICESAVRLLNIKRRTANLHVAGIGGNGNLTTRGIVSISVTITDTISRSETIGVSPYVLGTITAPLPSCPLSTNLPDNIRGCKLADPKYYIPGKIDILIGADVYDHFMLKGFKIGKPCAQLTKLGWILFGPSEQAAEPTITQSLVTYEDLDATLQQFWEIEEPSSGKLPSADDNQAELHYQLNTVRKENGRYFVSLPFKPNVNPGAELQGSDKIAFIRFRQLEDKLRKDPQLYELYSKFMKEYLALGHMHHIPTHIAKTSDAYYMPHHAVLKESSSTTKLRVVFNASQKATKGNSLNELLLTGPAIQANMLNIIMRWRQHRYVIAADIEKMYRLIGVNVNDQKFQRILWRFNFSGPIHHYALKTVTYGTASAPFLAIRTLHQLAMDEGQSYPEASKVLLNDFYVDDVLTGSNDLLELEKIQVELRQLLHKGGFHLRKWTANHFQLLASIPHEDRETNVPLDISLTENIKTLGLKWHPAKDVFTFSIEELEENTSHTKRSILSDIAKLFDPLGWLQPCIITGKITMRNLWASKYDWDSPLDNKIIKDWMRVRKDLTSLRTLNIPRWINYSPGTRSELHGFSDASANAYAAAVYIKVWIDNTVSTNLIMAKSKVAPVQNQLDPLNPKFSPRLELCGAVLLTRLMKQVTQAHNWEHIPKFYWTDSTIVLAWIRSPPTKWEVYVANRVSIIQQESSHSNWYHVNSASNPADLATRGVTPTKLISSDLWWHGPSWLNTPSIPWRPPTEASHEGIDESTVSLLTKVQEPDLLCRFSNATKLFRVAAYCRRFVNNARKSSHQLIGPLSCKELEAAQLHCIRLPQQYAYSSELEDLKNNKQVSSSSHIRRLSPQIDPNGILRVGGRIQHAILGDDTKQPAIIPKGEFAKTLILSTHKQTLHGGVQLTLATLRLKYWIVNGHSLTKKVLRECLTCFKFTAKPNTQLMGILPSSRVRPEKPFTETGLDYAGPITMKWNGGRGAKTIKSYIAVFVCMATKAFHLELVSDMSTETCIAAIRRFISRRGKCRRIFSDCGTNFIGASKQLKAEYNKVLKQSSSKLFNEGIEWNFIPPGSPHFGGLWEAGVKSTKRHLLKTIGGQTLNVEELYTLLAQIEACLNSRPLTETSTDPSDHSALTPGHFLTGGNIFEITSDPCETKTTLIKRWRLVQYMKQSFWRRWSQEYLQRLQERPKWLKIQPNVKVGEVVLVKSDMFPSYQWPLARIIETHPGPDGLVRVVTVKMNNKFFKRPITKICPLPFNTEPTTLDNTSTSASSSVTTIEAQQSTEMENNKPPATKKRKVLAQKSGSLITTLFTAFMIFGIGSHAAVNITHLPGGLYAEHPGVVNIIRGSLHVNIRIPWESVLRDQTNLKMVANNISQMCHKGSQVTNEINCEDLIAHLNEFIQETQHKINTLRFIKHRAKRGLLGRMLNAVFGVNDEIIADVNTLADNQNTLKQTVVQEGKIVLRASKYLNATSNRIDAQLKRFTTQLNQGLQQINSYTNWYAVTDHNKINLYFLGTYQRALNYVQETFNKYSSILTIIYTRTGIWECIKFADLEATINKTQVSLPPHLVILHTTSNKLQISHRPEFLELTGYLPIIDNREYELIKVTAIPTLRANNTFAVPTIDSSLLGINYNDQLYFKIEEPILQNTESNAGRFLLPVSILYDLRKKPNCVISQLYELHSTQECQYQVVNIQNIIWKRLFNRNTWLFLTPKPLIAQTLCNGERSTIILNGTGVVRLSPDCTLFTDEFSLISEEIHTGGQFPTYIKPLQISINSTLPTEKIVTLNTTEILKSTETFSSLVQEQEDFTSVLENIKWTQVKHHGRIAGISLSIATLSFLTIIVSCHFIKRRQTTDVRQQTDNTNIAASSRWYDLQHI